MNKKLVFGIVILVLFLSALALYFAGEQKPGVGQRVTNFQECAEAGFPIMESYPEQCSDGQETFTRDIGNELEKIDLIRLENPRPGDTMAQGGTYELSGDARGYWFFEASFPFEVISESGEVLASHYATAEGEWMTEEFVPFSAELSLPGGYKGPAKLILRRSNASGLSEHDNELIVPIIVGPPSVSEDLPEKSISDKTKKEEPKIVEIVPSERDADRTIAGGCFVGGCSSQICSEDPDVITTCEWREEYACYQSATCERQVSGQCGWTQTADLMQCLSNTSGATM